MTEFPEELPDAIPNSVEERVRFLKGRYIEYKRELVAGNHGAVPEDRARPIANQLSLGDLLSLLGRHDDRAFRIQLEFEELRERTLVRRDTPSGADRSEVRA